MTSSGQIQMQILFNLVNFALNKNIFGGFIQLLKRSISTKGIRNWVNSDHVILVVQKWWYLGNWHHRISANAAARLSPECNHATLTISRNIEIGTPLFFKMDSDSNE